MLCVMTTKVALRLRFPPLKRVSGASDYLFNDGPKTAVSNCQSCPQIVVTRDSLVRLQ